MIGIVCVTVKDLSSEVELSMSTGAKTKGGHCQAGCLSSSVVLLRPKLRRYRYKL